MTQRNFYVNHGLECGDIVISAVNNTITGLSTAAPTADGDVANKKYVDDSVSALSSTTITQLNSSVVVSDTGTDGTITVTADGNTEATFTDAGMQLGVSGARVNSILDEDNLLSNSATALATQQSIKAYVDTEIGNISSTAITEGNSNVTVTDSGTGTITVVADGGTVASFAAANTTLTASTDISLSAGADVNIPANVGLTFGDDGEKIEGDGTKLTVSSSNDLTLTATGNTTVTNNFEVGGNTIIQGDLTVNGTETILSTQNLTVEDAILGLNRNISAAVNMPRFSGLHIHRGSGSAATELDLYMVWDEQTNATGSTTNLGGTFTFLGSVHEDGTESPNTGSFTLADIKASVVEADLTGNATTATEATNVTVTANNTANETVYLTFVDGATGTQGLETDTDLSYNPSTNELSTTATSAQYADLAEMYVTKGMMDGNPHPVGTVMYAPSDILEPANLGNIPVGTISENPAFLMNKQLETAQPIALKGRVPVRVVGPVKSGQPVYVADGGVASANDAGQSYIHMVGIALSSKDTEQEELVECILKV